MRLPPCRLASLLPLCCLLAALAERASAADPLDLLQLGSPASEQAHALTSTRAEIITGGLGEPARRLLPSAPVDWRGGSFTATLAVDPSLPTYLTVRLWGSDTGNGRLVLLIDGRQVGYHHLGDVDILDLADPDPSHPGRFVYKTTPLPTALTAGKTSLSVTVQATGWTYGYANTFEGFQRTMDAPSRGIYRLYTHTAPALIPPAGEIQGEPPRDPPARTAPGREVLDRLAERVNRELAGLMTAKRPPGQLELMLLARAWHVPWTVAHRNLKAVEQVVAGLDAVQAIWRADPKAAQVGPGVHNADWLGLGPSGEAIRLLAEPLAPYLDQPLPGAGGTSRRAGWTAMLVASRDWHRQHRRLYTNQSMINDLFVYAAHAGVAAIAPEQALPEAVPLGLLHESVGLTPWLGSDTADGPAKPMGDAYFQTTAKGLTRELGYVGSYGEVLDWVAHCCRVTAKPGDPRSGDPRLLAQLAKLERARAPFRYPTVDRDGCRAMRIETVVGWRDVHHPGDICYGGKRSWESSAIYSAATTLDPAAVGAFQQMVADGQFFPSVDGMLRDGGTRVTLSLLPVPGDFARLSAQPPTPLRLPMAPGQGDSVFADEEDGVVAVHCGDEVFYASLYWRARFAVNGLARVHWLTPRREHVAVVREEVRFRDSGLTWKRPDWIAFGFANGGPRYPAGLHSALAGEVLPVAAIPAGMTYIPGSEHPYAGRPDLAVLRYGPWLVAMNLSADQRFPYVIPADAGPWSRVASTDPAPAPGATTTIEPRSTLVLRAIR